MSFRRDVVREVGGFARGSAASGATPLGCEETELCIRLRQRPPGPRCCSTTPPSSATACRATRATLGYFRSRCHAEGRSKAGWRASSGATAGRERARLRGANAAGGRVRRAGRRVSGRRPGRPRPGGRDRRRFRARRRRLRRLDAARRRSRGLADHITVVAATCSRPRSWGLPALVLAQSPQPRRIVVVDAPRQARDLACPPAHGGRASSATSRATAVASRSPTIAACGQVAAPIVAFTDDDVLVDRDWLARRRRVRRRPHVGCVTGTILPLELETPAQAWIEGYGGYDKGFARQVFDLAANAPPTRCSRSRPACSGPAPTWRSARALDGSAASTPRSAPGRRPGAATTSRRSSRSSARLPPRLPAGAIVRHHHRRDYAGLERQVHGYGVGLAAYLTEIVLDRRRPLGFARPCRARPPTCSAPGRRRTPAAARLPAAARGAWSGLAWSPAPSRTSAAGTRWGTDDAARVPDLVVPRGRGGLRPGSRRGRSRRRFADHVARLAACGYRPVTVRALVARLRAGTAASTRGPSASRSTTGSPISPPPRVPPAPPRRPAPVYVATGYVGAGSGWLAVAGEASAR